MPIPKILSQETIEDQRYLREQIITYIGNKRGLLNFIGQGIQIVQGELGREKLNILDLFSGSGVVSRYLKQFSNHLYVNDLEEYSSRVNHCYLANHDEINLEKLFLLYGELMTFLHKEPLQRGFISELYAPESEKKIKMGERVFYTPRNAAYIDTARAYIETFPLEYRSFFLAPLLSEASIHVNTPGIFKGFYKNKLSGIGEYGGTSHCALQRIKGDIEIPFPLFSLYHCDVTIFKEDANTLVNTLPPLDLAYLDPPYNQHPYGSNYFMLNLICENKKPKDISPISGIPINWNRSVYNQKKNSLSAFENLVRELNARYLLISFNSEGFINQKDMKELLSSFGELRILETKYNTFKGSRNLFNRNIYLKEYLYLLKKY